jgi:hypothetical protein
MDFLDPAGKLIRSFTSTQDPKVARDSLRNATRADSLKRAGVKADSAQRSEARSEETPAEDGPRRAPVAPRVANKAGLNTFSWNLRYPDASTFQNIILWAGGTQGPVAVPGAYTVRMKINNGASTSQTFRVVKDPRSKATQADLNEQFAFLVKVRDETSKANDAVKLVRNIRSQIDDRTKKLSADKKSAFENEAKPFEATLSDAEKALYQTQNRSGQDPLNYPIRLNNKIAALAGVAASTDARPTDQTLEVYRILSAQIDAQVAKIKSAVGSSLPKLNQQLTAASLKPIVESTAEEDETSPAQMPGGDEDSEDDDQ